MNHKLTNLLISGCLFASLGTIQAAQANKAPGTDRETTELPKAVQSPPASARPGAYWYWRHELHTPEGVTADLEAMARVGIGEMIVGFIGGKDVPIGDMQVLSPKWWEIMRHTAKEANRVGVKLRFFVSPGWSATGGPWIPVEMSMQDLVWSETRVKGPGRPAAPLPHPPKADMAGGLWRFSKEYADSVKGHDYLGDVAVIAFPTPLNERWDGEKPKFTCDDPQFKYELASDGNRNTLSKLANPTPGKTVYLQLDYGKPFPARSLNLISRDATIKHAQIESSDDGATWRTVAQFEAPKCKEVTIQKTFKASPARYWRLGFSGTGAFSINEMALNASPQIEDWTAKNMSNNDGRSRPPFASANQVVGPEECIPKDSIIDLTDRLKPDGTLDWDAPAGDWTVIRFGRIPSMKAVAPANPSGCGLEVDKYNAAAVDLHWKNYIAPLLADKDLNAAISCIWHDSYEKGSQNWSPRIPDEFNKRAGYDLRKYMPILTGRIIDNVQTSERFLWDYRKTLCDTMADSYFGRLAQLARENGKVLGIEPYDQTQFDTDVVGTRGDICATEFHNGSKPSKNWFKNGCSPAHIQGLKFSEAEAFTSMPQFGGNWSTAPWDLKGIGDFAFASGVNRYIFHVSNQQPWLDLAPGVASPWGQHMERTNTWFGLSYGWIRYIQRCQFMLQQGRYVGDFLVHSGQNSPNQGGVRLDIPAGYEFDNISTEAILGRLEMKNGKLTTGGLAEYQPLLVLPPEEPYMTAALARKLKTLVEAGMTLVGPRPVFSPTLNNRDQEDRDLKVLSDELWGKIDGKKETVNMLGKGRVIYGEVLKDILDRQLKALQLAGPDRSISHIHRETDAYDIWFVANTGDKPVKGDCAFRTNYGKPELWDAMTGKVRPLENWRREQGGVIIPLSFEAGLSCFRKTLRRPKTRIPGKKISPWPKRCWIWTAHGTSNSIRSGFIRITAQAAKSFLRSWRIGVSARKTPLNISRELQSTGRLSPCRM